jgi:hypothetical protein
MRGRSAAVVEVVVCRGPPVCSESKEGGCDWCIRFNPLDPDWEQKAEREKRGN